MKLLKTILLTVITSVLVSTSANANLIVNGGFEDSNVNNNSWKWFTSADVLGWEGSNIEIWDQYQNFNAYEGRQYAELNAHPSNGQAFSIFQSFATNIGSIYNVSFAYSARANTNEAFQFDLFSGNNSLFSEIITDHTVKNWSTFNLVFQATAAQTTLKFTSVTPYSGTIGNFLDDVVVTGGSNDTFITTDVPEPHTLLLFSIALIGFTLSRKKA